jgi:hypothetical protein
MGDDSSRRGTSRWGNHRGRRQLIAAVPLVTVLAVLELLGALRLAHAADDYRFDQTMPRAVLERYLSRAISMEGMLHGRGDLAEHIRMLSSCGAKFIGRSLCLWGGEAGLAGHLEQARQAIVAVHRVDPEMILQGCVFEVVTRQVEGISVPDWAFTALGLPVESRSFRYQDMLYANGRRVDQWGQGSSVPDVSRSETKMWFYYLAASFIDLGIEAIHFGQAELMDGNDPDHRHWAQLLSLVRRHAGDHARRHLVLCDAHVPSGGLLCEGRLLPRGRLRRWHLRPQQGWRDRQRLELRAPPLPGRAR